MSCIVEELVAALPDADKLETLATWLDIKDREWGYTGGDVQRDLRMWAKAARALLERAKEHDCIPLDDVMEAAAER